MPLIAIPQPSLSYSSSVPHLLLGWPGGFAWSRSNGSCHEWHGSVGKTTDQPTHPLALTLSTLPPPFPTLPLPLTLSTLPPPFPTLPLALTGLLFRAPYFSPSTMRCSPEDCPRAHLQIKGQFPHHFQFRPCSRILHAATSASNGL